MLKIADVAQLVEQLICNQQVIRSNRIIGSIELIQILSNCSLSFKKYWSCFEILSFQECFQIDDIFKYHGEVSKWSNEADCRSVG